MAHLPEYLSWASRLASFEKAHQGAKRRASSQSKAKKNAAPIEWPHRRPRINDLARAGFVFKPSADSPDNVQCFSCGVKLDGWEEEDDAFDEHLAHTKTCPHAIVASTLPRDTHAEESRDPMSQEMVDARTATFHANGTWAHESKRGWKCKVAKMVGAGWSYDTSPDADDGVTCFYCEISLDGWEPKDDPWAEHQKRTPDCIFFKLLEQYGHTVGGKLKAKPKGRTTSSTASKVSRLSSQSRLSTFSDAPDSADLGDGTLDLDDSTMTTGTVTSQSTVRAAPKKAAKPKVAAKKGAKKTKTASLQDSELGEVVQSSMVDGLEEATEAKDSKPAAKKPRGRKPKKQSQPEPETLPEIPIQPPLDLSTPDPDMRISDASAQLQEELENSIMYAAQLETSTPEPSQPKRGTKRTSDGIAKSSQAERPNSAEADSVQYPTVSAIAVEPEVEVETKKPRKGKAAAKKPKVQKATSARSSKASTTDHATESGLVLREEDLQRDEMEIDAELARIEAETQAAEEALARQAVVQEENEKVEEYEPSPSRSQKHSQSSRPSHREPPADVVNANENATPSPSGSDKENVPSSIISLNDKPTTSAPVLNSPSKTPRVPLLPGTPNRSLAQTLNASPSKHVSRLASKAPWNPVDLDVALLASPKPSPATLQQRLAGIAGLLTSPEKRMTVEELVRHRTDENEKELRRRCETMVGVFEREGLRALQSLDGLEVL